MVSPLKASEHVLRVLGRVFVVGVVLYQGISLDQLVVEHHEGAAKLFPVLVAVDVVNAVLLTATLWLAYFVIRWMKQARKKNGASRDHVATWYLAGTVEVPRWVISLPSFSYCVYVSTVCVRLVVIFAEDFDEISHEKLSHEFEEKLEISVALTALVFFLFVLCHQNAFPNKGRKVLIDHLTSLITLDVLDTVEFMALLFEDAHETPTSYLIGIMVFTCVSLVVPTVALFDLTKSNFGARDIDYRIHALHLFLNVFLLNIPFLVVRLLTKAAHGGENAISFMIIKNLLLILHGFREIFHIFKDGIKRRDLNIEEEEEDEEEDAGIVGVAKESGADVARGFVKCKSNHTSL